MALETAISKEIKGGNAKDLGLHIQKELKPIGFEISNDALNLLIDKTGGNSRPRYN